jgi:hypothetical protein
VRHSILALFVIALGCNNEQPKPGGEPSAKVNILPVTVSPSASVAPAMTSVWFEGKWKGSYDAAQYTIETPEKNSGAREWKSDDGGTHVGDGTLDLEIGPDGRISGTAKGALGEQNVTGEVDETKFRISFVPKEPGDRAFSGSAVLTRSGESVKGRLSASSGDSKTVRDAAVILEKGKR